MVIRWLLVLVLVINTALSTFGSPRVYTPHGIFIGYYKVSQGGRKYEAYEGIPYAKPPIGDLRFEEPQALSLSSIRNHVINATKKSDVCAQYANVPPSKTGQPVTKGQIVGSDDCLYMNIYVPVLKDLSQVMPAIFFIHGGAFQYASGNMFPDIALADRDVIFVTVNYRLGILGFLSTEDEVLPGNLGLKDQSTALKWVAENILSFRGNPRRIILVGFSAGSSSIQYHYLSPWSRGLFHGSVGMSGTTFNTWATAYGSNQKAKKLGAIFNCPTNTSRYMIDCLKKVPVLTLVGAEKEFQYWQYNPMAPFAPVVEKTGTHPFISKSPKDILDSKEAYDVPAVYGSVSEEGCYTVAEYAPHDNLLKQLNDNWFDIVPQMMYENNFTVPKEKQYEVAKEARQKYFGNRTIDKKTVWPLLNMVTDQTYFIGFENGVRLQAKANRSPVYFYYYSYRASKSFSDVLSRTTNNYGACHSDDMNLVLDALDQKPPKSKKDRVMQKFLMDIWVSVAYKGVPEVGVQWNPVDPLDPELKYLHISEPGKYKMSGNSNFGQKSFWKKFFFTV